MEIVVRASVTFWLLFLVTLGDIVQQGITQEDYSLTGSMLAVTTFGFWVSVLSWLSWRSDRARRVIEGVPLVLVQDGRPVDAALKLERMPLAEVLEAARQQGVAELEDVRLAILEPSGRISIIPRER
jgi:uncharacterized membrane protein YcaP (DUF421 family)